MDNIAEKKRDIGLDVTRLLAFICVPAVHFFMNTEYYFTPIMSKKMYLLTVMRTFFFICVPLFLIISGYLSCNKKTEMTKKGLLGYYYKILPIFVTYVIANLTIMLYRRFYLNEPIGILSMLKNTLSYQQYSWYVNMYIGLALLIPFLNVLWQNLKTKEARRWLVGVLVAVVILPSLLNIFDFSSLQSLFCPWTSEAQIQIIPNWWTGFFPLVYYFIGAYIKDHVEVKKLNKLLIGILIIACTLAFGLFNVWKSYSKNYVWGIWSENSGWQVLILSVLVFLFVNSFNYPSVSKKKEKVFAFISKITFGAFIVSWIPDNLIYHWLNPIVTNPPDRIIYFPLTVLAVGISSLAIAAVIEVITSLIFKLLSKKKQN